MLDSSSSSASDSYRNAVVSVAGFGADCCSRGWTRALGIKGSFAPRAYVPTARITLGSCVRLNGGRGYERRDGGRSPPSLIHACINDVASTSSLGYSVGHVEDARGITRQGWCRGRLGLLDGAWAPPQIHPSPRVGNSANRPTVNRYLLCLLSSSLRVAPNRSGFGAREWPHESPTGGGLRMGSAPPWVATGRMGGDMWAVHRVNKGQDQIQLIPLRRMNTRRQSWFGRILIPRSRELF